MGERLLPQFPPLRSLSPKLKSPVRPSPVPHKQSSVLHRVPIHHRQPLARLLLRGGSPSPSPKGHFHLDGRPVPVTHTRRTEFRVALEPLRVSDLDVTHRRTISEVNGVALQWGKKRRKEQLTMVNISLPTVLGSLPWEGHSFDSNLRSRY